MPSFAVLFMTMRSLLCFTLICACSKTEAPAPAPAASQPKKEEAAAAGKDWVGELEGKNVDGGAWKVQVWNCSDKIEGPWSGVVLYAIMRQSSAFDTRTADWPTLNVSADKDKPTALTIKTKTKYTTFPEMTTTDGDETRALTAHLDGKSTFNLTEKYDKGSINSTAMYFTLFGASSSSNKTISIPLKSDQCDGKNPKNPINKVAPTPM